MVYYADQRQEVTADRFIIGRGKKAADLVIDDPNVSRRHAVVERIDGQYCIADMGSTNGIDYSGQRVAQKAILPGDVFRICQYVLRFEYE